MVKLHYSQDEIGDFEWFVFLANSVSFFWSLGLKNAFMSYFPGQSEGDKRKLIFNIGILFIGLGLFSGCGLAIFSIVKYGVLYEHFGPLILFVVLGISATLTEHILIVLDKSRKLFVYGIVSYTIYLCLLTFTAISQDSIDISQLIYSLVIWAILRFIYLLFIIYKEGSSQWDYSLLKKFVLFGSPLIVHVLLGGGMEFIDGFLVDAFYERADFTVFRYGARELPINTIFISALASAAIPFAVTDLGTTLVDIRSRLSRLMHWLFPLSAMLIVLSPYIFTTVYSEEYLVSAQVFSIYLLIISSRILLPQVILYANHKNTVLMWVALLEIIINVSFSLILMQYFGLLGIAFATVLAYLVQKIVLIIYNKKILKVPLKDYIDIRLYFLYSILLYLTFVLTFIYVG